MNQTKEDLLLHPVRLRIILAAAGREITARQLAGELPDIPQASLYRNIKAIAAAGILKVVHERRVHNTLEKTYALQEEGLFLTRADLQNAQPEDYLRLFTQFLGHLLGYYARYIQQGIPDLARDNVLFEMSPFYLSAAETRQLAQDLQTTLAPYLKNEPSQDRRRSILGLTFFPDAFAPVPAEGTAGEAAPEHS